MKINCTNPECRQRLEVDDSMAGKAIRCPSCSWELDIPISKDIRLNCVSCGQHIVVDVSEAGRFIKCPACAKLAKIPGAPAKSFIEPKPEASASDKPEGALGFFSNTFLAPIRRVALGWAIGGVILAAAIAVFHATAKVGLPLHFGEISDEIYLHGIGQFRDTPVQVYGKDLLFLKYVGNDVNIFHLDLTTTQSNRLATIRNISEDMGFVWVGSSPSERQFAYCARGSGQIQYIFFCDSTTGKEYKSISIPKDKRAAKAVWLSDNSIIMESEDGQLYIANTESIDPFGVNGAVGTTPLGVPSDDGGGICIVSSHAIAYAHAGNIWTFDLITRQKEALTHMTNQALSGLCYSPKVRTYLFAASENRDDSKSAVFQYAADSPAPVLLQDNAMDPQWIQDGLGVAFTQKKNGQVSLNIKTKEGHLYSDILDVSKQSLQSFAVADDQKSLYGMMSDKKGRTVLVKYDISARSCADVCYIQGGYVFARSAPPVQAVATNHLGKLVEYFYIPPPDMDTKKRYPVLMDMTSSSRHDHGRDAEFLANCGILYVSPNKLGISKWGVTPTIENTLAVYDELTRNPNVDTNRIYITGESITTWAAVQMIHNNPGLWRGFVALEPATYPDVDRLTPAKFSALICMGENDQYNGITGTVGRAEKFLTQACARRIAARIHYEPGAAHAFQPEQYKDAYETVARFILKSY